MFLTLAEQRDQTGIVLDKQAQRRLAQPGRMPGSDQPQACTVAAQLGSQLAL